jgi:uncharacterized protein (DUF983 family)
MTKPEPHRSYFISIIECRCPRCRLGKMFKNNLSLGLKKNMEMNENCPLCGQVMDIEVGFYYGTGYVSYLIALLITVITFLLWYALIGFSFQDNRFAFWLIANSVLLLAMQPWLMRFSRSLWLSWFVTYDPDWKYHKPEDPERVNKEQMGNW